MPFEHPHPHFQTHVINVRNVTGNAKKVSEKKSSEEKKANPEVVTVG
jgi:hypothetical protein